MPVRTSTTHPIRVDFLPKDAHGLDGELGMTFAPGKHAHGLDGRWERDLGVDVVRLREKYGADVLVSLIEEHELETLRIQKLVAASADAGIGLDRFPIPDGGVPADGVRFAELVRRTLAHMRAGKTVVVHCRGGLGRTGLLAAACLRALGMDADRAMKAVRAARPGAIENAAQEDFVRHASPAVARGITPTPGPTLSCVRGCLLGGALGDSLGEPVEFISSAKEIVRRFGAKAPAKLGYAHGPFITDDTQMTLFAAEGIIWAGEARWEEDGVALTREVQAAFLRWFSTQNGRGEAQTPSSATSGLVAAPGLHHQRAPGNTCMSALQAQVGSKKRGSVASPLNSSKGCGAVMRAAPFGLAARTRAHAFQWARDTGAITHGHPSGYLSAAHFAAVIWGVSRGEPLLASIEDASALLGAEHDHEETAAAVSRAMSLVAKGPPSPATIESLGGAWVGEEALAIALLCAATCPDGSPEAVAEALWRAVAHAGDSDSTGSMVGNLLGAMYGENALPAAWLADLELAGVIDGVARDLHAALDGNVDKRAHPVDRATRLDAEHVRGKGRRS